jgi:3',5'-cyclic AMP phosphodiesterase CpdA
MFPRFLALLCACGALAAAPKIVGGPVAVNVGPRSATIVWVVQTDELTLHPPSGPAKQSPSLHVERTTLTGLQPNTHYEYEAGGPGGVKGYFKTAPTAAATGAANTSGSTPAAAVPFRFFVFGDTRTRHDMHRRVIDAVVKQGAPDFVIHTGDLVADGNDSSMWPVFFDIEKDLLRQTAFFPSLGNHERNSREYYDFFRVETPYYSFNWGNAHFSVLNTDFGNAASSNAAREAFWTEQVKWLEDDLAANQKPDYRFVVGHHPPMSAVSSRQEFNPRMQALIPMFEKQNVTAGFFGHDHNYQHYLKNGIHYLVTGGGGAPLYDVNKPDPQTTVKVVSTENFVTISVDGKTAKVQAHALDGKILDEFELKAK